MIPFKIYVTYLQEIITLKPFMKKYFNRIKLYSILILGLITLATISCEKEKNTSPTSLPTITTNDVSDLTATTVNTLFGNNTILYTTLVVIGRDSGARIQIPVQITYVNQS
jgi:hypothetical protein